MTVQTPLKCCRRRQIRYNPTLKVSPRRFERNGEPHRVRLIFHNRGHHLWGQTVRTLRKVSFCEKTNFRDVSWSDKYLALSPFTFHVSPFTADSEVQHWRIEMYLGEQISLVQTDVFLQGLFCYANSISRGFNRVLQSYIFSLQSGQNECGNT